MFAKVFRSMYSGSLADNWQALVTFQQLLILADANGVVDMTPSAIARMTGIPLEIITAGIEVLEQPDASSRTPDLGGRRIVRLDTHRTWGWFIVNRAKYRDKVSAEEKREADRVRVARKRADAREPDGDTCDMSRPVATCSGLSQSVADVAQIREREREREQEHYTHTISTTGENAPPCEPTGESGVCETPEAVMAEMAPAVQAAVELRKRGVKVNGSHPDLIAGCAEGVTLREFCDMAEAYPGKPAGYVIAAARRQHAEGASGLPPNARALGLSLADQAVAERAARHSGLSLADQSALESARRHARAGPVAFADATGNIIDGAAVRVPRAASAGGDRP